MANGSRDRQPVQVTPITAIIGGINYTEARCPHVGSVLVALINGLTPTAQLSEVPIFGEKGPDGKRNQIGSRSIETVKSVACYCCGSNPVEGQNRRTSLGLAEDYSLVTVPDGCCRRCIVNNHNNGNGKKGKRK